MWCTCGVVLCCFCLDLYLFVVVFALVITVNSLRRTLLGQSEGDVHLSRESNKGSKEKKGPTLGVRFIEVSSYTEVSVKKESTLLISLSCLKYCINTAQHKSFQIAYLWNVAPFLCQVVQHLLIAIHYKSLYREQVSRYIVFLFIQRIAFSTLKRQERFAFPLAFVCLPSFAARL